MSQPILEMKQISKSFGSLVANDKVDLTVCRGEIHGLLGENGAGKTTLMNILYGLYRQDAGEIMVDGKPVQINSPREAIELGIGMVHQHFMLVPNLTVAENVILGQGQKGEFWLDCREAAARIEAKAKEYGVELDPWAKVEDLTVGLRQRVEIFKALFRGARLLIFDEPTAVLTPPEVEQLFHLLRNFVKRGNAVICITHKLHEIKAICDRVTILRGGRLVGTYVTGEVDADDLACLMVGDKMVTPAKQGKTKSDKVFLRVENLSTELEEGDSPLHRLSLEVCEGEIMGVAGVDGNGQTNLAHCLAGLKRPKTGKIRWAGRDMTGASPKALAESGLAYIPADRHGTATVMGMSLAENLICRRFNRKPFSRQGFLNLQAVEDYALAKVKEFEIKTSCISTRLAALSGGNQQKAVLAREIDGEPKLIIAHQPTRGLDIGSTNYVHRVLLEASRKGASIILLSTELEELLAVCDRIAVMYRGQVLGVLPAEEAYLKEIGLMMAGRVEPKGGEAHGHEN
ncbi:MAG TPA: ABC transporter ATP-binding protein [Clostridia bacterium]|nr:ABC transporter ATP-binding protein [Clostridia bacterium]